MKTTTDRPTSQFPRRQLRIPPGSRRALLRWMLSSLAALSLPLHSHADDMFAFGDAVSAVKEGKYALAVERFSAIVKKDPKRLPLARESFRRLAWILATCPDATVRDGRRAIKLAEACSKLDDTYIDENGRQMARVYRDFSGYPIPMDSEILAAAHAEAGHFGKAAQLQKKALKDREKHGPPKPGTLDTQKLVLQ